MVHLTLCFNTCFSNLALICIRCIVYTYTTHIIVIYYTGPLARVVPFNILNDVNSIPFNNGLVGAQLVTDLPPLPLPSGQNCVPLPPTIIPTVNVNGYQASRASFSSAGMLSAVGHYGQKC